MNRIHTGTNNRSRPMFDVSISAEMHMMQGFKEPLTGNTAIITKDTILTEAERA
jgi:hypothetical protein